MTPKAVVFDLGGVVLDSPLDAIADHERRHGLPDGIVNRVVVASGPTGAWARHERGEIDRRQFLASFRAEFVARGHDVDVTALMDEVDDSIRVRPAVLRTVDALRSRGLRTAALTNNWSPFDPAGLPRHFDVVVESVVEGTRKPERRIYEICLARLGVEAGDCLMLDDLGPNLKPAREMGMRTVKVRSESHALEVLEPLVK